MIKQKQTNWNKTKQTKGRKIKQEKAQRADIAAETCLSTLSGVSYNTNWGAITHTKTRAFSLSMLTLFSCIWSLGTLCLPDSLILFKMKMHSDYKQCRRRFSVFFNHKCKSGTTPKNIQKQITLYDSLCRPRLTDVELSDLLLKSMSLNSANYFTYKCTELDF